MPIKSIIIVVLLLLLVWIPVLFDMYNCLIAAILTFSFIVVGLVVDKVFSKKDKGE
jgi:hypothetical protein